MAHSPSATLHSTIAPTDAFARLVRAPGVAWLDSSLPRPQDGRFSIMTANPRWEFSIAADLWRWRGRDGDVETGGDDGLRRLDALLDAEQVGCASLASELPFFGGAIGWLGYELGYQFEPVARLAFGGSAWPDLYLAWYDAAIVWDHASGRMWLTSVGGSRGVTAVVDLSRLLASNSALRSTLPARAVELARSNLTRDEYTSRVVKVRDAIARGEYYQLNLVQRFMCRHDEAPADTYLRLRAANPAPFAAFLGTSHGSVLSSSPERFLEVAPTGSVRTCPIKGTRPRGATRACDLALQAELEASAKERAELLMIVDLLRNDLGRVCVPGSIRVCRLHALESFATVHHLVGEVCGQLRSGLARRDLIRAVFPGGSITGAPKVSAMRAISRLEPNRRGVAMGSIGYFSVHGRIDFNIAIRTILSRDGIAEIPVGAGIVWDSDPAAEYEETLTKARALFDALRVRSAES